MKTTTTTTMIKLVISGPFLAQNLKTYKQNFSPKIYLEVPYPEVFWGGRFFDECSVEKNCIGARVSGGRCKPSPVGSTGEVPENFGYLAFCGAQNIVFVTVCEDKQ